MLYSGEQYDSALDQYYLRARYYDPTNGHFNRVDPYAGNTQDPQSLHKYLYCHANPANNTDPTGLFSFGEMLTVAMITGLLSGLVYGALAYAGGASLEQSYNVGVKWFWRGFVVALVVYGAIWAIHSLWIWLFTGGAYGGLEHAEEYGICSHGVLRSLLEGTKLVAHHIIPDRFAQILGLNGRDMLCVAVKTGTEHNTFTNAWRDAIPYGTNVATVTLEELWMHAQAIYADYPALLEAAKVQLLHAGL